MYSHDPTSPELVIFTDDMDDDVFELDFPVEASGALIGDSDDDAHIPGYSQTLDVPEDVNIEMWHEFDEGSDASSESDMSTESSPAVIHHIEDIVLSFLRQLAFPGGKTTEDDFSDQCDAANKVPSRSDYKIEIRLADRRKPDIKERPATKCLRFPKKSCAGSSKPFAQLFKVLDLAHEAKIGEVPVTKRDIYYKDVALFKAQKVVDTLVDDLAATFQLERSELNIRASSKGLICGSGLTITLLSGECIHCNDSDGSLIPAGEDIEAFGVNEDVAWVLVVEKEAVFQTLCRLQISKHESMPGPGIVITGKGYPDVATRHIVKSLADALPRSIPIMALVDGDPFGLDILSVYKYGSRSMQHENEKLATRRVKWLGVWASELERLNIDKDQLLPITKHDEKKALSMLQRENAPIPARWRKELQYMLHSRHKAEIEILSSYQGEIRHIPRCVETKVADDKEKSNHTDVFEPGSGSQCASHGLLLRYLQSKVNEFVALAEANRERGV